MTNWIRPILSRFVANLSLVLTLAGLAGLAWLGHHSDWKVPAFSDLWNKSDKDEDPMPEQGEPTPLPIDDTSPPGVPLPQAPELKTIRLESPATAARAGFRLAPAQVRTMSQQVRAYGVLDYDQTRYAHLSTRAPGMTWRVLAGLGDRVHKGDVLAIIESMDVGKAKADFLQSLVQVNVKTTILKQLEDKPDAVPERTRLDARTALREARIKLLNDQQTLANLGLPVRAEDLANLTDEQMVRQVRLLGLPPKLLEGLDLETLTANLLPLKAPFDGEVISRNIVIGEIASPSTPQFALADVSRLWVMLDVRSEEAGRLSLGQEVVFAPDGAPEEKVAVAPSTSGVERGEGTRVQVDWISPEVDEKTRTVRVRATVPNSHHQLRPHTFGTGRIIVRSHPDSLVVPNESLQADGPYQLVFVRIDDQTFEPRLVQVGVKDEKYTEILSGLTAGELVVTTGSFVLKTELFKDRLGGDD